MMSPAEAPTTLPTSQPDRELSFDFPDEGKHYRVAAIPADYAMTDDVVLCDQAGHAYLLSHDTEQPLSIKDDIVDSLGMFFEPSQDSSWHTASELRQIIYGIADGCAATP